MWSCSTIMLHIGLILPVLHIIYGYENIALHKPTYQSHGYWISTHGEGTFDSSNAVDGLKTDLTAFGGQCVISADYYQTATWWVNLTSIHSIHDIRIYYRTDNAPWDASNGYTARFLGFFVYISNTTNTKDGHLCFHDTNYTRATIPAVANITCPVHGQYVIYFNKRPQNSSNADQFSFGAHNELCEVEVYGCNKTGYYGPTCSSPCPDINCRYCHIETGACQGCKPGYKGHQCELPCSHSFYGDLCSLKCGNCSDGKTCHHVSGKCTNGCDAGVYGDKCKTPCPVGWHGENCSRMCSNCDTCDRFTGTCTSPCKRGWEGLYCRQACSPGRYGKDCKEQCGHCERNEPCHHVSGSCPALCEPGYHGEKCLTVCTNGWYGKDCKEQCGYCRGNKPCHHVNGSCFGFCEPEYSGEKCEDSVSSQVYQVLANQMEMLKLMKELISYQRRKIELKENGASPTDFK